MFLGVPIVRYKMDNLYTVLVVYIILVMSFITFLWRTTQSVVVNIDCTVNSFLEINVSFPPVFYVTNLNCDLFDLIN